MQETLLHVHSCIIITLKPNIIDYNCKVLLCFGSWGKFRCPVANISCMFRMIIPKIKSLNDVEGKLFELLKHCNNNRIQ